ncbi:MAG TPA: ferrochelatase [Xanthomonadaceae bacterium]|nr:ferrochelatase [Xanthomonadaceae bacterium]
MPAPDTAVLLVNLGTPEAPTPAAVRRYLAEFLSDPRVVSLPALLWQPLLRGVILPLRGMRVAEKYASIWLPGGSPLAVHTRALAEAVQQRLPDWRVASAMRYGTPPLRQVLEGLRANGARRVLVLPLYPQYSTTTTASVADVVAATGIDALLVDDYHLDPGWIAAVAGSIRAQRAAGGNGAHLLFSFHGLPQRLVEAGDPYQRQCEQSARAIARALCLDDDAWSLAYQSRFGRERWLGPSTAEALDALAARGVRLVDVACPGFAVDCLETLEEVAMMLAERFRGRGGTLRYVPCLNAAPAHADALAAIARRALAGASA